MPSINELRTIKIVAEGDSSSYVRATDAATAANKRLAASSGEVNTNLGVTERKLNDSGSAAERVKRKYIEGYGALQQYNKAVADVLRFNAAGKITDAEKEKALEGINRRYVQTTHAVNDNARAMAAGAVSAGQLRASVQNLSFQIQDIGVQLAGGASPFRVLAQQGSQVVQAFSQGGGVSAVLAGTGRSIAGLVTPTAATVAGIAALAAGFGALVLRTTGATASVRQFDVAVRGLNLGSGTTGADLEAMAKRLRDVGLTAEEARGRIAGVIRAGLNPASAERVVRTGENLNAALGDQAAGQLEAALAGGLETTVKFGLALRAFRADQVAAWREMARGGEAAKALNEAFGQIEKATQGLSRDALSPMARVMRDLAVSWNSLLDALANTRAVQAVVSGLTAVAAALERLLASPPPQWLANLFSGERPVATAAIPPVGGAARGTAAAALAEVEGMVGMTARGNAAELKQFMNLADNLSPEDTAWCAYFANAALARQGIRGTGSGVATSFLNWGKAVSGEPQPGDVLVIPRGRSAGQTGGHVGLATGSTRMGAAGQEFEYIAGNESHAVARAWTLAAEAVVRRAAETGVANPNVDVMSAEISKIVAERQRQVEVLERVGAASDVLRARQEAEAIAADRDLDATHKMRLEAELIANVYRLRTAEQNKLIAQTEQEISALRTAAEAYNQNAEAGMRAEAAARANAEAFQQFGETQSKFAKDFIESRSSQLVLENQDKLLLSYAQLNAIDKDRAVVIRQQAALQGETTEEIQRQTALTQVMQEAQARGLDLTNKDVQARLQVVDAVSKANAELAETQRAQQRIESMFRSIADSVERLFTDAFEAIFSGERISDWGTRIRSMFSGLATQLATSLFLRPAIGSLFSSLGLTGLASQYGSFGGMFGGGGAAGGSLMVTTPSGGTINLGTLSNGASLANSAGLFGGGLGGIGSWLNTSVGPSLGFWGGVPYAPGLFGTTSLTSALGGVGLGFGAGSLLNNLLGGNSLTGTLGSGAGSLAGTLIGSMFGGPVLGGLFGGPLGSIHGKFEVREA